MRLAPSPTSPLLLCQNYTISYFVFEKVARCVDYPPNGEVTFTDISIFYDGVKADSPDWTTGFVDAVRMRRRGRPCACPAQRCDTLPCCRRAT